VILDVIAEGNLDILEPGFVVVRDCMEQTSCAFYVTHVGLENFLANLQAIQPFVGSGLACLQTIKTLAHDIQPIECNLKVALKRLDEYLEVVLLHHASSLTAKRCPVQYPSDADSYEARHMPETDRQKLRGDRIPQA
jgi:hypothetical protein